MHIVKVGNYEVGQGHPLPLWQALVFWKDMNGLMIGQRTKAICEKIRYSLCFQGLF